MQSLTHASFCYFHYNLFALHHVRLKSCSRSSNEKLCKGQFQFHVVSMIHMYNANIHMNSYFHKIVLAFQPIWWSGYFAISHFQCQWCIGNYGFRFIPFPMQICIWFNGIFRYSQSSDDWCMWKASWWHLKSCLFLLIEIPSDILFDVSNLLFIKWVVTLLCFGGITCLIV